LRYHLIVSTLRESAHAIWAEVCPCATIFRISISRSVSLVSVFFTVVFFFPSTKFVYYGKICTTLRGGKGGDDKYFYYFWV